MSSYKISNTEKLPHSEVKITGSLSHEFVSKHEAKAIENLQKHVKLDGFREGKVPAKMIKERMGDLAVYEEAAIDALNNVYIDIVKEAKIMAISRPQISITKLVVGTDVEFTLTIATLPQFDLPDYKKIGEEQRKNSEEVTVEEKEIEDAINRLRHMMLHQNEGHHKHEDEEKAANEDTNKDADEKEESDSHDHKEEDLPKVDAEFIKHFGEFKDVDDFRAKIKESLAHEKGVRVREKKRLEAMDKVLEKTTIDVPHVLIENETDRLIMSMKDNIANMGLSYPDYLGHIGKTEESLRAELKPDAEKRAKIQLILNKIAAEEKLIPKEEQVKHEVEIIMKEIKEADPERAKAYVETMLTNELVWQLLEGQEKQK